MAGIDPRNLKSLDNGLIKFNLSEESRKYNKDICDNYGRDLFTWTPEITTVTY